MESCHILLLSSRSNFVPCDLKLQRAYLYYIQCYQGDMKCLCYRLVAFRCVFEVILLVFVQPQPNHDVQLGLDWPSFGTITALSWQLEANTSTTIVTIYPCYHSHLIDCNHDLLVHDQFLVTQQVFAKNHQRLNLFFEPQAVALQIVRWEWARTPNVRKNSGSVEFSGNVQKS